MSAVEQCREALQKYVKKYKIGPNDRLPSERDLAVALGLSRVTVRKVMDDLELSGCILRRKGKGGTILLSELDAASRGRPPATIPASNVVSAMVVSSAASAFGYQNWAAEYMMRKYRVTATFYHARVDQQDPGNERQFLEHLVKARPRGLLAHPSPFNNHNGDLYAQLHNAGTRVAHIGISMTSLPQQGFFLPDVSAASVRAVHYLHACGCRRVAVGKLRQTPYMQLKLAATRQTCLDLGMEFEPDALWCTETEVASEEFDRQYLNLSDGTGILLPTITPTSPAMLCLKRNAGKRRFAAIAIGVIDEEFLPPVYIPSLRFSMKQITKDALAYIMNEPECEPHKLFAPVFHPGQTGAYPGAERFLQLP